MYSYLKIKIKKNQVKTLLKEFNDSSFNKGYINLFINQIDEHLKIVPLQSSYYFYNYLKNDSFYRNIIKNIFDEIFEISFESFHKATKEFQDKDLEENIHNSFYFLKCLENRIEFENKLYNFYLKFQNLDFLEKILVLEK